MKFTEQQLLVPSASLVVFKIGGQRIALSSRVIFSILTPVRVYPIPNVVSEVVSGFSHVKGRFALYFQFDCLLKLSLEHNQSFQMVALELGNELWFFSAEAVLGIRSFPQNGIVEPSPSHLYSFWNSEEGMVWVVDEIILEALLRE